MAERFKAPVLKTGKGSALREFESHRFRQAPLCHSAKSVEGLLDAGEQLPMPRALDELVSDRDLKGMVWAFVDIPIEALDDSVERINLSVPRRVLRRIDESADRLGRMRSSFMAEATLLAIDGAAMQRAEEALRRLVKAGPKMMVMRKPEGGTWLRGGEAGGTPG